MGREMLSEDCFSCLFHELAAMTRPAARCSALCTSLLCIYYYCPTAYCLLPPTAVCGCSLLALLELPRVPRTQIPRYPGSMDLGIQKPKPYGEDGAHKFGRDKAPFRRNRSSELL